MGDSTGGRATLLNRADLENVRKNPTIGWGFPFTELFDLDKINVVLRAQPASTRTYIARGFWDSVLPEIKRGDFVLLQFGEFERSPLDDPHHGAGPLPGVGDETQVVRGETIRTYGGYMRKYIADIRAKGAIPIVLAPNVRDRWTGGKVDRGPDGVRDWAAEVAHAQNAAYVDITDIIADRYESLGQDRVRTFYYNELVHTNLGGARIEAALIVSGLKALSDPPLASYLSARGQAIPPAAPAYAVAESSPAGSH